MIGLVAAAGARRTIGAAVPGFVRAGTWLLRTPARQVALAGAVAGRRAAAGFVTVDFAATGLATVGLVAAGFAAAVFAAVGLVAAGFAAAVFATADFAAVFLASAVFAAIVFFVGPGRAAGASFFAAALGADPVAAALARVTGLVAAVVAFAPAGKAARMRAAWASSTVLRFVLTSTPCFLSQAIASATGILSSLASCPILVFAI